LLASKVGADETRRDGDDDEAEDDLEEPESGEEFEFDFAGAISRVAAGSAT
jgi:hypothetical protein